MNWDRRIEIEGVCVKLVDLLDQLLASITKEEADVLGGELIKFAELSRAPFLLGD